MCPREEVKANLLATRKMAKLYLRIVQSTTIIFVSLAIASFILAK